MVGEIRTMQIITGKQPKPVKGVIYGPEGVGKSSLGKEFPKPLFIDVEGGTSRLDLARTPKPNSFAHFKQILGNLARDPMGFQTIVIDTADWLEKLAIKQICAEYGIRALGEGADGKKDYGKSFSYLDTIWSDLLTQLEADFIDTGKMHVVFIAHSTTRLHELPEEAGQYDRYQIATNKKVAEALKGWADLVLFVNYQTIVVHDDKTKKYTAQGGQRRMMYAERTAAFDAKNRDGLPREMDLGFAPLAQCFTGLSAKAAPAPVAPNATSAVATPAAAPIAAPTPEPAPTTAIMLQPQHVALQQLLASAGVTYEQLNSVLAARGKYPENTPLANIDPAFIEGYINPHWAKVLEMINGSAAA